MRCDLNEGTMLSVRQDFSFRRVNVARSGEGRGRGERLSADNLIFVKLLRYDLHVCT